MRAWKAKREDIPRLVEIARKFHALGPFKDSTFDADKIKTACESFFDRTDARIFMTENGAIGVRIDSYGINQSDRVVRAVFLCAERCEGQELIQIMESFARQNGNLPTCLTAHSQSGEETTAHTRLYAQYGYKVLETHYVRQA